MVPGQKRKLRFFSHFDVHLYCHQLCPLPFGFGLVYLSITYGIVGAYLLCTHDVIFVSFMFGNIFSCLFAFQFVYAVFDLQTL